MCEGAIQGVVELIFLSCIFRLLMVNLVELFLFFSCNVLSCNGDFSFSGKLYVGLEVDF